jgi:hypothetical protein
LSRPAKISTQHINRLAAAFSAVVEHLPVAAQREAIASDAALQVILMPAPATASVGLPDRILGSVALDALPVSVGETVAAFTQDALAALDGPTRAEVVAAMQDGRARAVMVTMRPVHGFARLVLHGVDGQVVELVRLVADGEMVH